jgi:hypothetical protein
MSVVNFEIEIVWKKVSNICFEGFQGKIKIFRISLNEVRGKWILYSYLPSLKRQLSCSNAKDRLENKAKEIFKQWAIGLGNVPKTSLDNGA